MYSLGLLHWGMMLIAYHLLGLLAEMMFSLASPAYTETVALIDCHFCFLLLSLSVPLPVPRGSHGAPWRLLGIPTHCLPFYKNKVDFAGKYYVTISGERILILYSAGHGGKKWVHKSFICRFLYDIIRSRTYRAGHASGCTPVSIAGVGLWRGLCCASLPDAVSGRPFYSPILVERRGGCCTNSN